MPRSGLIAVALLLAFATPASATLDTTSLVSVSTGTSGGNDTTYSLGAPGLKEAITPDGRYLVFVDRSSNLTATPDANGANDVFWRDLQTGQTKLVSINAAGTAAGASNSQDPGISDDGRYVVFSSYANDLVAGYTGSLEQIYVRDMVSGTTTLVSRSTASATTGGNNNSSVSLISGDGHEVVWLGRASDLESPDVVSGTITHDQLYARNLQTGVTSFVTISADGTTVGNKNFTGNAVLTPNGRYVAFATGSDNLVTGYTSPGNGITEVYRRDLQTGTTTLVTATTTAPTEGTNGTNGIYQPGISDDGRYVAFDGNGLNMVTGFTDHDGLGGYDVYLRDVTNATTSLVSGTSASSTGNAFSEQPRLTGDGRYVLFTTYASDLVSGDTNGHADLLRWDRTTGTSVAIDAPDGATAPAAGGTGPESGATGAMSADGNHVAFATDAPAMVAGLGGGGFMNVYLRDVSAHTTQLISAIPGSTTTGGNSDSQDVWMSTDASRVVWTSVATDLIASFTNLNGSYGDYYARATSTPPPADPGGGGGGGGGGGDPGTGDPGTGGGTPPASTTPPDSTPPSTQTTPTASTSSDPAPRPPRKSVKCKKGRHHKGKKCVKNKPKRHRKAKKPKHQH